MWEQDGKYVCTFLPETISETIDTVRNSKAIPLEEGRIVSTAYIQSELTVYAIKNPNKTDKLEYCEGKSYIEMKHIFFPHLTKTYLPTYTQVSKSVTLDVDKDGKEEVCTVFPGITSGLFTFKLRIFENNELEYENTFLGEPFSEFYFEQYGYFVTRKSDTDVTCYKISVRDGNIYLESNGRMVPYHGEQGVNENGQKDFDIIVSDRTVSWEYSPTLSATWHYVFNLDFQCNQDSIEIFCNNGKLIDLNSSPQTTDTQFYLKDKNSIGWTPEANVHEAPKNSVINFILRKNGHVTHTGEIHIYAVKTTDMTVTYQAYISSDDGMFFSKDAYGIKITSAQSSIKYP